LRHRTPQGLRLIHDSLQKIEPKLSAEDSTDLRYLAYVRVEAIKSRL
jgi:hypothetical protein